MNDEYVCPFCGRILLRQCSLTLHKNRCRLNPDQELVLANKIKHSLACKAGNAKPGVREHRIAATSGEKSYWYGKHLSAEHKRKIRESSKKTHSNPDIIKKKSEASKKVWSDPAKREMLSKIQKEIQSKPEVNAKRRVTLKEAYKNPELIALLSKKAKISANNKLVRQKEYETKKKNGTFNTSKIEEELKEYFNSNNIEYISQYKSDKYPFCCDFYFPQKDLYVEIQGSWTHGGRPYISDDIECIEQLEKWKAKSTKYYDNAIETWTIRDIKKRETAKINKLNWIEIFSNKFNVCITEILRLLDLLYI